MVFAALFARLGVWQLARRSERIAFNERLISRLDSAATPALSLTADTALGHYRRITAGGVFLYERQLTYAGRTRNGSPGVYLLTPMRVGAHDTLLLVNRGWAYSPDARAVQPERWRERDSAVVTGYAETYTSNGNGVTATASRPAPDTRERTVRSLDRKAIEQLAGSPVAPYVLVQTSDSTLHADSVPVRLVVPSLDEGPHASYAVQWFSFAAIALVGGVLLFRAQRDDKHPPA